MHSSLRHLRRQQHRAALKPWQHLLPPLPPDNITPITLRLNRKHLQRRLHQRQTSLHRIPKRQHDLKKSVRGEVDHLRQHDHVKLSYITEAPRLPPIAHHRMVDELLRPVILPELRYPVQCPRYKGPMNDPLFRTYPPRLDLVHSMKSNFEMLSANSASMCGALDVNCI